MKSLATIFDNPIFVRELRRRMRGRAIIFSLVSYVILMCVISFIVIFINTLGSTSAPQQIGQSIGLAIFYGVSIIQAFLVLLAAPSITSSMTTAEREKQTFEFLQATTLSARAFVIGNLLSTLMYVLIVLVCAMPVISVTFLYGGISIDDVLTTFGILLSASLLLTSFALLASSINTRTRSVQAVVTVVCVLALIYMLASGLLFAGFRARGGVPVFLQTQTILGITVKKWIILALPFLTICALMIIAAGRKLYVSDNRLFNYRQFLVIFVLFDVFFMAAMSIEEWFAASLVLLVFGALNFSCGRPLLGDETWVIKRRWRALRHFDEGLAYMLGIVALWAVMAYGAARVPTALRGLANVNGGLLGVILEYGGSATLLYYCTGRLVSQFAYTRQGAFRVNLAIVALLYFLLPLLWALRDLSGNSFVYCLSPLGFIAELSSNPGAAQPVGQGCSIIFLAVALGVFFLWALASRRHRKSDYHFDLVWPESAV